MPALLRSASRLALLVALLVGTACTLPGSNPVEAGHVRAATVRMQVALARAADAYEAGRKDQALEAWRDAHQAWDDVLAPGLEPQIGAGGVVSLELHLARIRADLERDGRKPRDRVQAFAEALESPLRSLPPAPGDDQ